MGRGQGSYIRKEDRDFICSIKLCLYCGDTKDLHIEHIHALNKGGNSHRSNLTRACKRCNSLKSTYCLEEFYLSIFMKREKVYDKCMSYIFRLEREYKRNVNEKLRIWLIEKIREMRELHCYYTKIINSLITGKYLAN